MTTTAPDLTRADVEEALHHLVDTRRRKGIAWADRVHAEINDLLDQLDRL